MGNEATRLGSRCASSCAWRRPWAPSACSTSRRPTSTDASTTAGRGSISPGAWPTAGPRCVVPTTLNVSSLDLLHPELVRLDPETAADARALMDAYVAMGCRPTWTCAPYQLPERPAAGEHVAWAESNAIVFANSVLGARTGRYGDFIDICCAITGRAPRPACTSTRSGSPAPCSGSASVPAALLEDEAAYAAIGHLVGQATGTPCPRSWACPPPSTEDQLKALGAAAASSGAVAMFHAVGVTPEAAHARCGHRWAGTTDRSRWTWACRSCGRRAMRCRPWRSAPPSAA